MPQLPRKPWKKAVFAAVAGLEHALRGHNLSPRTDLRRIRNFLILQYDLPLGSVVHATPFFEAARRIMPDVHITVAASGVAASVLGSSPYIDCCVVTPNLVENFGQTIGTVRGLLASMPPGPRCILTTIGNRRPRIALLAALAGKALRAGHTAAPELYDIPLLFVPERGQIEGNLDLLRALGHTVACTEPHMEPNIFFTQPDADHALQLLEAIAGKSNSPRIAFVTQNSGGQRNQWNAERFRQVIAHLSQAYGATPIFVGAANDATGIESMRQSLSNSGVSLAGKTTVPQLAAVLTQCDGIISLDTGTFHVARAVGLPGIVIAPAWQNPMEWLPMQHPRYCVLRGPSITAPRPDYWIDEISAEHVIDTAIQWIEKFPPSIAARRARLEHSLIKRN